MRSISLIFLALLAIFAAAQAQHEAIPGAEPEAAPVQATQPAPAGPATPATTVESAWLVPAAPHGRPRLIAGPRPELAVESLVSVRFSYLGEVPADGLRILAEVPAGMRYVADSATGPGVELAYSVDGGVNFMTVENLPVADEVTHVRWDLPGRHVPGVAGLVSFRARLLDAPAHDGSSVLPPGL